MDRAKILYATLAALAIVAAFAGYRLLGGSGQPDGAGQETADMQVAPGMLNAQQLRRLGVQTVAAEAAMDVPLGTVPAAITLPPEAQVAVTAPFDGAIVRLHVIQGQQVSAGQALATRQEPRAAAIWRGACARPGAAGPGRGERRAHPPAGR
ncbi:MAG: hypothetical protein CL680_05070 [Blastomonas sp.]|nr:hypothetical protein [Blastomonas sp.]